MDYSQLKLAFCPLVIVSVLAWSVQVVGARWDELQVWKKLTEERKPFPVLHNQPWHHRRESELKKVDPKDPAREFIARGNDTWKVVDWKTDKGHWEQRAACLRTSFFQRTQESAEKWRNIFASLFGVFSVVFFFQAPPEEESKAEVPGWVIMSVIALAVHAVAYTGWAAAGLSKMQVDVNAQTALGVEMRQGTRALARLRVGIISGALTAVGLVLIVAVALG